MYQRESARVLESLRASKLDAAPPRGIGDDLGGVSQGPLLGRLEIASAGVSATVAEGVDSGTLRRAVGHVPGSPLPGQPGRAVLAAHRDGFFKHLGRVRPGDRIAIETPEGDVVYRVRDTAVIKPANTQAAYDGASPGLTLVTCYPFEFLGSAPLRYIVRADQVR
jgi:sortase A